MSDNRDEAGFTLIELLLSITILSIVLGAIVTAMTVFLSTGPETSRRDDHSSGAALAASYLDRDLASADTLSSSSNACSGLSNNRLVLSWTDYTSSTAAPVPVPTGGTWTVAYALVTYNATDVAGSPTRYDLKRWYCPPGVSNPVPTLVATSLMTATDLTASVSTVASCAGTNASAQVVLRRYGSDPGPDYTFTGCLKGRRT